MNSPQDTGRPPQTFLHKVAAAPDPQPQEDTAPISEEPEALAQEPVAVRASELNSEEPGTPEVPDSPEVPESPEVPDSPEFPDSLEAPDAPEVPVSPTVPDSPEVPDGPQAPSNQGVPGSLGTTDGPLLGAAADDLMARWRQVAASFVDDPRAAVSGATDVVSEAISRLRSVIREREQSLNGRGDADTEELRQAMLGYRRLLDTLLS